MTAHRQIFKSSAIIGAASAINVAIGLIKVKVLAVLLGPVGVGQFGLYQNIMGVASTLAGCGMASSGVRQLAASKEDKATLALVRKALFYVNLLLGLTGMAALWFFREPVAMWVFGNPENVTEVGYLGLGVLLTLLAGSQTALLQGLRRINDLARVQVLSALAGATVGMMAVMLWGRSGMLVFILSAPAASVLVAAWYARRLPRPEAGHDWSELRRQWQAMFSLGIPLMTAGLLTLVVQLRVRSLVTQNLGLEATGYFQAAWVISVTYLGFVLNAMGAEYFPRLTGVINDHERAKEMINQQAELLLLVAGPVLLAMMSLAPWVIEILYSNSFVPATEILRWQVLGDIIKVMTWPMSFVVLAIGRGGVFIVIELVWNALYLTCVWFGLPAFGLVALGLAYFLAYLAYIVVVSFVVDRLIGFRAEGRILLHFMALMVALGLIFSVSNMLPQFHYGISALIILMAGYYSVRRLNDLMNVVSWMRRKIERI